MRRFLPTLAVGLALVVSACHRPAEPWSVVLVTLDTTRADALGCYGAAHDPTPNLDRLAAEGVLFEAAYAASGLTPVSHASILTGLEPYEHGVRVLRGEGGRRLSDTIPTLTTTLAENGWRTAAFHGAFAVPAHFGFLRGFEVFESFDAPPLDASGDRPEGEFGRQRRVERTLELLLPWLERTDEPFFLWLRTFDPHDGLVMLPDEFVEAASRRAEIAAIADKEARRYAIEIRYLDRELGRLFDALGASGRLDRTLIVVVADHGESLGEHDWDSHRLLYQEHLRVPLILRLPEGPRGVRVRSVARSIDLFPTVLDYLDLAAPAPISGASLRGTIEGRAAGARSAYCEQINGYDVAPRVSRERPVDDFLYGVIDSGWKLIWHPTWPERAELFELATDPGEVRNRALDAASELLRLKRLLAARIPWVVPPFSASPEASADAALDALGYTGGAESAEPIAWSWTCPEHADWISDARGACPRCGSVPLLTRRR